MVGCHHRLNGHGFGWTPGVGDRQGGLVCSSSWGCKESDMTERLNWTEPQTDHSSLTKLSKVRKECKRLKQLLYKAEFWRWLCLFSQTRSRTDALPEAWINWWDNCREKIQVLSFHFLWLLLLPPGYIIIIKHQIILVPWNKRSRTEITSP